ncbi:MAG TPA: MlaD family protein, partial [Candidatus Tumulicola sp.]|nr:MlaD family protein [Candidatus Tumulicola sp.]
MSGRVPWWRRYQELPVPELQRSNPLRFGLITIVLLAIVLYFGFTKHIPGTHGFRLKAQFGTVVNIAPKSPVRIAGVPVGKVTSIQRDGDTGVVTMEISKAGLPIHRDATAK